MALRAYFALILAFGLAALSLAQTPGTVLATYVRKETGIAFTHKVTHSKESGTWACVMLKLRPKTDLDSASVLGLLVKKGKKWTVRDYVLGTSLEGTIKQMQKKHSKAPKAIFPKKIIY